LIQINPLRRGRSYPAIDHRRVPEPIANGSGRVVRLRFPREETLPVATLLALAGGYIDAYTWITHQVFANAQTANMLSLWIHAMAGRHCITFRP
jgi:hypothetical protein